ncbi:MAG TPA: serine protease, partial [Thermoguttaceae bacterium]|nr:serine protease [Thermoguttaceae bacterium]
PTQMQMGDEVRIVGFPSVGGSGAQVSVTLTRGIVSGFEKTPIGVLMKTDALIAPGSSGGAALDSQGRLIGVPTSENVLPEVVGRMSYIHPLTLLPAEWWKRIQSASPKP